jgi:hypothetical protein
MLPSNHLPFAVVAVAIEATSVIVTHLVAWFWMTGVHEMFISPMCETTQPGIPLELGLVIVPNTCGSEYSSDSRR